MTHKDSRANKSLGVMLSAWLFRRDFAQPAQKCLNFATIEQHPHGFGLAMQKGTTHTGINSNSAFVNGHLAGVRPRIRDNMSDLRRFE